MKSNRFNSLFGLAILFTHTSIFADYTLSGIVKDKATGQTIPDANITLTGTDFGAASQDGGRFYIPHLEADNYQITVHVIGYAPYQSGKISLKQDMDVVIQLTPQAVELNPVIVTATLSEHLKSNVTVASEVYAHDQLRQMNGFTAGELLELSTGMYFRSYDGLAGNQIPTIRGSNTDQVVVLLDDIRLNTAQGGGVDLNLFPAQALERIEVIRGGHSALLGSDAIGGAIHLISQQNIGPRGYAYEVQTTAGSFGTQLYNARFAQRIGNLEIFTHFNQSKSEGDFKFSPADAAITLTRENNDAKSSSQFLKASYQIGLNHDVQLLYNRFHQNKGIAGSVNMNAWTGMRDLTPAARGDIDQNMMALSVNDQWSPGFKTKAQIYQQSYDYHYTDPEAWAPADDIHENDVKGAKMQGLWNALPSLMLHAGAELRREKLTSTTYHADVRSIHSMFGQAEYTFQNPWLRLTLIPAVRYDDYSDVGSHTSPRLGILITRGIRHQLGFRGNISRSFRVPTLNDLYWPADAYTQGNPELKPETAKNMDWGLMYMVCSDVSFSFETTYFNNVVEDLILWAANSETIWTPQNVGRAAMKGLEMSLRAASSDQTWFVQFNYTRMKATDQTSGSDNKGKRLIYRPDNKTDLWAGLNRGPFSVSFNYRWVSKSYTDAVNTALLDGYQIFNMNVGSEMLISGTTLSANLQINNLLDKGIYVTDGYPLPGREYRVTFGVKH